MTEIVDRKDDSCVRVALRVRPQNGREKVDMCQICTSVLSDEPQVVLGKDKAFTFDYVFNMLTLQETIYDTCVRELIDGCFEGYNATVFAYGQTGSGKTYTMGTGFDVNTQPEEIGIIPRAVEHLFIGIENRRRQAFENGLPPPDFKVNAQFMELYNEEIIDLLDTARDLNVRNRKSFIRIHEDAQGGIYIVGATARPVISLEDTLQCLKMGALSRTTASTNMNVSSSRSHAIFTLHIKQHRLVKDEDTTSNDDGKDTDSTISTGTEFETLTAKFHFVDLAGSERLKRTGATGDRAKEGISINCGLLALGNVISALGDKVKRGSHVPYRDSKLTRLLQDSLGGNSRTLMIACISPSDRDFMETLNTLKYANRARNIKNKVIANQDKASRQIASLRAEIQTLQHELMEYKTGKRMVDAEGKESVNDMVTENSMLQIENDKMRQRVKALSEAIESLKADNAQLMTEATVFSLMGKNGEICNDDIINQIKKYVLEIEDLKAKLAESEATVEQLRLKTKSPQSPSHMTTSSLSMISSSLMSSSVMSSMGGFEAPASPEILGSNLLKEAKRELQLIKKAHKKRSLDGTHGSDKENNYGGGDHLNSSLPSLPDNSLESSAKTEEDETDFMDEEDEEDDDIFDSDSQSESDRDSDNIQEDLAELTCEISIKQRLIEDLERVQKNIQTMKAHYEEKVQQLQNRIKETEQERDIVLSNMGKIEATTAEKSKKVLAEYERKLSTLQLELKKMQTAHKEHVKMVRNNSHTEKQLKTLQHELAEMKRAKVKLMKQVKEESERTKQIESRRNREVGQMKREQLKNEIIIKNLEREKQQKELILRRKQEEVESLRKRQKPMSRKAAGQVGKYDKPPTQPIFPFRSRQVRTRRDVFSPKAVKNKWEYLKKHMTAVVTKKQTIMLMERDMEIWLKQRERTIKKLEHYQMKRKAVEDLGEREAVKEVNDIIQGLQQQIDFTQDNIKECQMSIMQIEENKEEEECLDINDLLSNCGLGEARYLIDHCLQLAIERGLLMANKEAECRELKAKIHQAELNNTLQQDLLRHMMQDNIIELDNLMTHSDADDNESLTSSSSSSPADSMFEVSTVPLVVGIIPTSPDPTVACQPALSASARKEKARRKTATPEDLLYAVTPDTSQPLLYAVTPDTSQPLLPILETPEDEKKVGPEDQKKVGVEFNVASLDETARVISRVEKEEGEGKVTGQDQFLMPPPKTSLPRPGGTRSNVLPSPSMRRKETGCKSSSPEPSPRLPRKNTNSERIGSHSSSVDTASDTTPPSSPPPSRRIASSRSSDENVFSRLAVNVPAHSANKGSIVLLSSARPASRTSLLTCTHTAKGHTKAVLAVDATDQLLLSGSKDRTAKIWDLGTGKEIQTLAGHPNTVLHIKYCPTTHLVFTVSQSAVRVWDLRASPSICLHLLSSSGLTATGPAASAANRQLELTHREHSINDIAVSQAGSILYCAAGSVVQIWDLRRYGQMGRLCGHQAQVMALAVDTETSPEGHDMVISGSKDHYIKVFEVLEDAAGILGPKYHLEPPHYDGIQSLVVSRHILFSGSRDTCIKKWDLSTQTLQQSNNSAHKDWVCALDLLPGSNGHVLLSACRGGMLKLWSVDNFQQLAEIKAHNSPINAIATNSSQVFTASNESDVRIWQPYRVNCLI